MKKKLIQRLTVIGLSLVLALTGVNPVMAEGIPAAAESAEEADVSEMTEEPAAEAEIPELTEEPAAAEAVPGDIEPGTILEDTGDMQLIYAPDNVPSIDTESAESPSFDEVYDAIIAQKANYPEGMWFTNSEPAGGYIFTALPDVKYRGWGCAAFAFMMSDAAFGSLPGRRNMTFDWDSIRVGDILRTNYDQHAVIVMEKYTDYIVVAEANYNSSVHWGRKIYKKELADGFTWCLTRYPNDPEPNGNEYIRGYSFTVTDVRTGAPKVFNLTNGNKKVLILGSFYKYSRSGKYVEAFMNAVNSVGGLGKSEIWIFDAYENENDEIMSALANISQGVTVVNSTTDGDNWENLLEDCIEYIYASDDVSGIWLPFFVLMDGKGNILRAAEGDEEKSEEEWLSFLADNKFIVDPKKVKLTQGFVDRLYSIALNRAYDSSELQYWTDELLSGAQTGAKAASGFIFSPEMEMKKLSDADFVKTLYEVMMGRTAQESDIAYWSGLMENGYGRPGVFREFVDSREFKKICSDYGIEAGDYSVTGASRNPGLSAFMSRLYTKALDRAFDRGGIDYWCEEFSQGRYSLMQISTEQFFHSPEFEQKQLDNEGYIKVLYRTFFDRECNADDLTYWQGQLFIGRSRDEILYDFYASPEFGMIRAQYGL